MSQVSRLSNSNDRKLRYRALLDDLSTLDIDSANNDERMERTGCVVREAQSLLAEGGVEERARHPGEGYLDSRVLRATSDLAVRCSESVSGNVHSYDRHELAAHIKENPSFWDGPLPLCVPVVSSLFGTFAATPPELRPRAPRVINRQKQALADLKQPDDVDRLEKTEEGSEMVSRVYRFITKTHRTSSQPLSYFHTVLDPGSFSRTVENIYYVSFLVRDQLVSVDIDEEHGLPFITPIPAAQRETDQRDLADENQFIVSIDMQRWEELVQAFDIKKPMMVLKRS